MDTIAQKKSFLPTAKDVAKSVSASLDLYQCPLDLIESQTHFQEYIESVCQKFKWKTLGYAHVLQTHISPSKNGYCCFQLLETGFINIRSYSEKKALYIDFLVDLPTDVDEVLNFSKNFFDSKYTLLRKNLRL